jgi:hypothetical protein
MPHGMYGGGQVWANAPEAGDAPKRRSKATTASASQLKPLGWTALLASSASVSADCCWWWACQDLNLGPHPYKAHSRDAFQQLERWGDQVIGDMSVTVVVRPMPGCPPDVAHGWHAGTQPPRQRPGQGH